MGRMAAGGARIGPNPRSARLAPTITPTPYPRNQDDHRSLRSAVRGFVRLAVACTRRPRQPGVSEPELALVRRVRRLHDGAERDHGLLPDGDRSSGNGREGVLRVGGIGLLAPHDTSTTTLPLVCLVSTWASAFAISSSA